MREEGIGGEGKVMQRGREEEKSKKGVKEKRNRANKNEKD